MQSRILVVEDDALQQSLLKAALEADGYAVETSSDGLDAVWKIREGRFDLVLVDYRLPEINGLATARLVGDLMGEAARPRMVALTAMPDCVIGQELLAGKAFDGVIAKSVDLPALLATVGRFLRAVPSSAVRREAEDALLVEEWGKFDVEPERPVAEDGTPARLRILVAEDDPVQRSVLKAALEASGYHVETACNGLEALRSIREHGYDLALIDYQMPDLDGLAAARLVLDLLSEGARPRMIAFTAAPDGLGARQTEAGRAFDEVIAKSTDLPELIEAVNRHLRRAPRRATRRAAKAVSAGQLAE